MSLVSVAGGAPFDRYGEVYRAITPPPIGAGSFGVVVDALPDGRLIAVTGVEVFVEAAPGAGEFAPRAVFDESVLGAATDPAFVVVSPSGSRIAVGAGDGKPLLVIDSTHLADESFTVLDASNTAVFDIVHFAAAWLDDHRILLGGGAFGESASITLLDVTSAPVAPDLTTVIFNIDGASGGIAVDVDGAIYTGNGFDNSPAAPGTSDTGWIKRFTQNEWAAGADFEKDGVLIGDVLSAASLRLNEHGDLFVGGGDFFGGDAGYLGVIAADALAMAIDTGAPIDRDNPDHVKRLDPLGNGFGFFNATHNAFTDELILADFGGWFATSGRRPGDLNGDDAVDGADLAQFLAVFGSSNAFADLNADGVVDGADLAMLLANWGVER